jgi:predicted membrane protein
MGRVTRQGYWRLPRRANVVTMMGEAELDLRNAVIDSPDIQLKLFVLMGEQRVRVPDGVEVEVSGIVVMGERNVDVTPVRPRPGVPRLTIKVAGMMGAVRITNH